ncbi:unnamed protein product [Caenorhabditis auriculariae]|uniref:Uncharacterized protein n=1 Tax=Caenorhabditis auriculariae TaxID=2777116 RepID=A0A8S1H235_9PELO|nr:unnamed protein product [Caenorhabditis auriculariae]
METISFENGKNVSAFGGNRTPVECLEGIHADHYTTNAALTWAKPAQDFGQASLRKNKSNQTHKFGPRRCARVPLGLVRTILDAEGRDDIFRGGPIIVLSASRCQQFVPRPPEWASA